MKTLFYLATFVSLAVSAFAQIPRPYVYVGPTMNGSGYSTVAGLAGVGLASESTHFSWRAEASYDNAKKVNDGVNGAKDQHNAGRDRGLRTAAYYRFDNGWMFGPGVFWSELSTTGYQKQLWRGTFGVGKDYIRDNFSFRVTADVMVPRIGSEHVNPQGCTVPKGQCTNDSQGVSIRYSLPSPATKSHVFVVFNSGGYVSHATVTSTDPKLTAAQKAVHQKSGVLSITLFARF